MIENIRILAQDVDWEDSDAIVIFYEKNLVMFNNYGLLIEEDSIIDVIKIKAHYISALISKQRYTKALKIVDHIDKLLEKIEIKSESIDNLKINNKFHFGLLNGHLKNYKVSYKAFSELIVTDPENDLYKVWHTQMKTNLTSKQWNIAGYIGVAIVFGDIICGLIFNFSFDSTVVILGFVLIIISWLAPHGMNYLIKRKSHQS